ncbi:carbonic anhydrase [Sulfuricurvum sp. IAE1]|jgi:carbonic anhydrase|uniref:carbonic anhydrase n=1 Tax=Sulfuricurvum sp. IAE1 TaxID=2546102 RepID=UPI00104A69EE|nr:carbonic anhydrase [Sulfuricurvum sp. IAE1]MDD3769760.1 carbonic anhydrase [Sulfuricurvum sp.]MDX9966090.1 carbonic anhydrase [Sulfuricurvum sp.]TDA64330.1 carbonic anhydrase [Sulfuricurvum sp. IAE1]
MSLTINPSDLSVQRLKEFAEGNETFQKTYFRKNEAQLLKLAKEGQNPKTLFIGCSDSRVIPDLIVQSNPGDLFVIRNVGNFVAPYKPDEDFHSTAAGIEYAVNVLGVSEIIICGHSHCGAIESLYKTTCDTSMVHTAKWLTLGEKAKSMALIALGDNAPKDNLLRTTEQLSIITQIENLLTYPYVKKLVDSDKLFIHGWYYDIETGTIDYYDPDSYQFRPLSDLAE